MATYSRAGRRYFGTSRRDARFLPDDLRELVNEGTRYAALEIINDLAEEGPNWNGNFQDNWIAIPLGEGASGSTGGTYPYQISDIPKLSIETKEVGRVSKFEITNISDYAVYALDLEPGRFFPRGRPDPRKQPVDTGKRDITKDTFRGELTNGIGNARSTAELDWYTTYIKGGKMKSALRKGFKFGFKV